MDQGPGGRTAANQPDGVEEPQGQHDQSRPTGNHLDLTDSPTSESNCSKASTNLWQKHIQKSSRTQSKLQTG